MSASKIALIPLSQTHLPQNLQSSWTTFFFLNEGCRSFLDMSDMDLQNTRAECVFLPSRDPTQCTVTGSTMDTPGRSCQLIVLGHLKSPGVLMFVYEKRPDNVLTPQIQLYSLCCSKAVDSNNWPMWRHSIVWFLLEDKRTSKSQETWVPLQSQTCRLLTSLSGAK